MALSIFPAGGKKLSDYMILSMVKPASTTSAYFQLTVPEGRLAGIVGLEESGDGRGGFYSFSSISVSEDSKTIIYSEEQGGGANAKAPTKTMKCIYLPVGSKYKNFEVRTVSLPATSIQGTATVELVADKGIIGGVFSIWDEGSANGGYRTTKLVRNSDQKMTYYADKYASVPTRYLSYYVMY